MPARPLFRMLFVCCVITVLAPIFSPSVRALDPDTVMARHISALGGRGVVWGIDDFTITLEGTAMGLPAVMTIQGIYPDYYEESLATEYFETRAIHTPGGTRVVTVDGMVIEPAGLDREAIAARAALFNYAYLRDMSIPLLPDSTDGPTGFTMDTGANFGTHILFNSETNLIDGFSMNTGTEALTVFFSEYDTFDGLTFPGVIDFRGDMAMTLRATSLLLNTGLTPEDFAPPAETTLPPSAAVRIPLDQTKNCPIVSVKAGKKTADLLLNTTWEALPVISNLTGDAGKVFFYSHSDETLFLQATPPVSMNMGDLSFETPILTGEGGSPFFASLPDGADGVIGGMLFFRGPITIDPAHNEVIIHDRASFTPPSAGKKTRLTVEGTTPLVAGTAGGVYGFWIIDTGYKGFGYLADSGPGEEATPGEEDDAFVGDINVGGVVLEDVTLEVGGYTPSSLPDVLGGLGMGCIEGLQMTLDYREGIIYLVPETTD